MPRRRQSDSPAAPREETFADLARACTKFLLERDPKYRRDYERFSPSRDAYNARKAARK